MKRLIEFKRKLVDEYDTESKLLMIDKTVNLILIEEHLISDSKQNKAFSFLLKKCSTANNEFLFELLKLKLKLFRRYNF